MATVIPVYHNKMSFSFCIFSVSFHVLFFQNPHLSSLILEGTVFEVPVTKAVQLTREDAIKTALLLELDIAVSL